MGMVNDIGSNAITPADRSNSDGRRGVDWYRRKLFSTVPAQQVVPEVVSGSGSPDGMVPQLVERSISALVEEIERLRRELDLAHHYENFLGEEADRHPTLPVLNRRAMHRALGQLLVASEQAGIPGSLLYLHVGGIERLRVSQGLAASDLALSIVARTIRAECRQTDLIGYLDGGDFAIALALADSGSALEKAQTLADRLVAQPVIWQDKNFFLTVGFGLAHFRADLTADDALSLADAARRGMPCEDGLQGKSVKF